MFRFMNNQALSLWDSIATCERSNTSKAQAWEKVQTTLSHQLTLRICSAIQIASKVHSYNAVSFILVFAI